MNQVTKENIYKYHLKMYKKQTLHTTLYNPLEKYLPDRLFGCPILHLSTTIRLLFLLPRQPLSELLYLRN